MNTKATSEDPGKSSDHSSTDRRVITWLACALVVIHFLFLVSFFAPAISTPDANGYFAQSRMIAESGKTYFEPESIVQYIGPHWHTTKSGRYFCKYPPGLPAIFALFFRIGGPAAALLVNPLMASLSLLGLYFLCRELLNGKWGLLAAALMAVNPFLNEHALWGDSHVGVCFFLTWALFFLIRWLREDPSSKLLRWALPCGLFLGMIPTVRFPETVFLAAFCAFIALHLRSEKRFPGSLLAFALAAAAPIFFLCIRSQLAYGAFWKTGYATTKEQMAFHWSHFSYNALPFLQMLMSDGSGPLFIPGIIGIAIMCANPGTRRLGLLFALIVAPVTLLYMCYYWKPDPQSMRFLLPTFYVYTAAGVWLLSKIPGDHRHSAQASVSVILVVTILWGIPQSLRALEMLQHNHRALAHIAREIGKHVEPGNIIISCEGIDQYLDFIGRWRLADVFYIKNALGPRQDAGPPGEPPPWANVPLSREGRNIEGRRKYESLTPPEALGAFSEDIWSWASGKWKPQVSSKLRLVLKEDVHNWAGEKWKVYFILKEEEIDTLKRELPEGNKINMVSEIKIPDLTGNPWSAPGMPGMRSGPPRPGGPGTVYDLRIDGKSLFIVEWEKDLEIK